jgi:hypothetical protein
MGRTPEQVVKAATAEIIDLSNCGDRQMLGDYSCHLLSLHGERETCRRYECPWGFYKPPQK